MVKIYANHTADEGMCGGYRFQNVHTPMVISRGAKIFYKLESLIILQKTNKQKQKQTKPGGLRNEHANEQ